MDKLSQQDTNAHLAPVCALPAGTFLQEFEIKSVIGEGGFGIVYLAFDTLLEREVAIKEYLPISHATRRADGIVVASSERQRETFEKALRSFIAEARMLARFKHPALVEVLRFWEEQGTAYMVMPYYQGRPLHILIQEGFRIEDNEKLEAFIFPLLDGLAQLHTVNCYHRDISSDNILILENGSPLLLDFGAARSILVDEAQIATVILKPGFAPIEQYSEDFSIAPQGAWTDLYALCAVVYQAITGIMPTVSVARVIRDPLTPLADIAPPEISSAFVTAIDSGLCVTPCERPQSVQAFYQLIGTTSAQQKAPQPLATQTETPILSDTRLITEKINPEKNSKTDSSGSQKERKKHEKPFQRRFKVGALLLGLLFIILFSGLYWGLPLIHEHAIKQPLSIEPEPSAEQVREEKLTVDNQPFSAQEPPSDIPSLEEIETLTEQTLMDERLTDINQSATDMLPTDINNEPLVEPQQDKAIEQPIDTSYHTENNKQIDNPADKLVEWQEQKPSQEPSAASERKNIQGRNNNINKRNNSTVANNKPQQTVIKETTVSNDPQKATIYVCAKPAADIYANGKLIASLTEYLQFQADPGPIEVEIRYPSLPAEKYSNYIDPGVPSYRVNKQACIRN